MALTDKHMKFVDEYMIDMNATAAYRRAGYTAEGNSAEVNASRLLSNAKVAEEIAKRQTELRKKSGLSVEWVLDRLTELTNRCMQAEPVYDKEGNETGEYRFDSSGANKALDSIGRHLGMFNDKLKVDANNFNLTQDLTNLEPSDRRARIDELNRRRGTGTHTAS